MILKQQGDSLNSKEVYNSWGVYVGKRSKQNRPEAEIESLQTDIEDFEKLRKSILNDLFIGGDGHGLEWVWYCVSGGSHLTPAFVLKAY
jgi:hypothetical protein